MAYSQDLRSRVHEAYENKEDTIRGLGKRFKVDPGTVQNWLNLHRETGSLEPRPHGGGAKLRLTAELLDIMKTIVETKNDVTENEVKAELKEKHSIEISRATVGRGLRKLGLTVKKNAA